ncbi:MAG: amidohydrolase [Acidobacteria bacterium]|nr:MAG: amidohydrolase [Acidobacteriota bacterium]REK01273.1 MAG: amidohydrolase [Acidobacteriota bacterium]REK14229.1 MAG: amidohydrolase [Acidobacteriota bacterium]REK44944.1 MAG: amidohydrolase [Acidobacteriota bacterium]
MNSKRFRVHSSKCNALFLVIGLIAFVSSSAIAQVAVRGEKIYTMEGGVINNGVILTNNGRIEAVGPASSVRIPSNYKVVAAKVVTPGLIDAHTVIGLAGYLNQPHDQMQVEESSPMQPDLRAIDAYNAREELVKWVRGFGVTTIHTGHAPAALISGQTMIAKTVGDNVDEATVVPAAMISVTIGQRSMNSGGKPPGTSAKQAAMLREMLIKASNYGKKEDAPRDLKLEMMKKVIDREIPLLVTAHRSVDIMTALRIAEEFNIEIVLDGASDAHMLLSEIKASGFPVILHPTMYRAGGETENLSMETAKKLREAGIPFALQSGYETYVPKTRVVLFEAGQLVAYGLSFEQALATVTIDAARIIGMDERIGSIKVGKEADIAMYDGDPFEYVTHCTGTMIGGVMVSESVN